MPIEQRLEAARKAGFEAVEVNLEPGEDLTLNSTCEALASFRAKVESTGLMISAVYSRLEWSFPITSQIPEKRARGRGIIEALINAAPTLGTDVVLTLPGAVDNSLFAANPEIVSYESAYAAAQEVLGEIAHGAAQNAGVVLAVENTWNKFLLSPLEFARFIDELSSPFVAAYFDVGNALRTGVPEDWIRILGHRIKRVHVKDFRTSVGNIQGFVNLLEGDVDWPAVIRALEAVDYNSWLTAEVLPSYRHHWHRLIESTSAAMDSIIANQQE
ncbi:MAG: sugar phosphate isomerase/epimerase family protein [Candidatus Dormibacteraceae bacterium]